MIDRLSLLAARCDFLRLASEPSNMDMTLGYIRRHAIDVSSLTAHTSCWGVVPLETGSAEAENQRTEYFFAVEPLGEDGETPLPDIVGWAKPQR